MSKITKNLTFVQAPLATSLSEWLAISTSLYLLVLGPIINWTLAVEEDILGR